MGAEPNPAAMKAEPVTRHQRRVVKMDAVARRKGGITVPVVVLDLSYEGCGIETSVQFEAGEPITLLVLGRGEIRTHVCWCENGRAGLVFDPDEAEKKPHPRATRISISAEVSLRRLGQNNYRVGVNDLSPEGCKVELVELPRIGEHMLIRLDGLEVLDSEVCWVQGFVAGLRFERPIHPAVFDLLVRRLR
jgi:PilZ domain